MQSKAATVKQYLSELPAERRAALQAVRAVILENIDKAYEEGMQYGMIGYYVPHRVFPAGYHCDPKQPLPFAGLASQKNYMSLYMMCSYGDGAEEDWFRKQWAKAGKKLDMGKCCIRFKKVDDLALGVIGEAIRRVPAKAYVKHYESSIRPTRPAPKAASRSAGSPKSKKTTASTSTPRTAKTTKSASARPSRTRA